VASQILTELDGLEELKGVMVLAATNKADTLDPAVLRSGRLERHIWVTAPDEESRRKIFDVYLGGEIVNILAKDVDIDSLVKKSDGYSGADIEALVREAKMGAMREFILAMADKGEQERTDAIKNVMITRKHFETAMEKVKASLSDEVLIASVNRASTLLYNENEKEILQSAITQMKTAKKSKEDYSQLRKVMLYSSKLDFKEIQKLTQQLKKKMEKNDARSE
jgi:transitional endoplasmic reticulum ATPase